MFYIGLILGLCLLIDTLQANNLENQPKYSEIITLFHEEKVKGFTLVDNELTIELYVHSKDEKITANVTYYLSDADWFKEDVRELAQSQYASGVLTYYDIRSSIAIPSWLVSYLPMMFFVSVTMIFCVMLLFKKPTPNNMGGKSGGGAPNGGGGGMNNFSKARTKNALVTTEKVTFDKVAGAKEEKEELKEVVDFLKDAAAFGEDGRYGKLGARVPKGVLLVGPPGTGKTLLAKAVAGEAGVAFFSISGSDFVELYVGVGASRVRDLFKQAAAQAPCVIFIDEIDAVGRRRGAGLGGGHDEREQTLNQLLVEMDGFQANSGVVVVAATNRRDILDPALLRAGRFDREVYVGLPDIGGREEILRVHGKGKPLADTVDLKEVAQGTVGFTGADLENLLNEGALLAARNSRYFITKEDLKEAMIKVLAGPAKNSRVVTPHARKLTAFHEAGHAIIMHKMETHDPVHQITIVPRGQAGGMTIALPSEDRSYQSKRELQERLASLLGGRVAEELILGDVSTGASSDISRASSIARAMVTKYGMSEKIGTICYEENNDELFFGRSMGSSRSYSESVAQEIDLEVQKLIDVAYTTCETILKECDKELHLTAEYLLAYETMEEDMFRKVFDEPEWIKEKIRDKADLNLELEKNPDMKLEQKS